MSTTNRYNDLSITRCKLLAMAEMFFIPGAADEIVLDGDAASGVFAILSDICKDLEEIEKEYSTSLSQLTSRLSANLPTSLTA